MLIDDIEAQTSPIDQISEKDVISWCDNAAEERYPLIVSTIQAFSKSAETNELAWKPIVYSIFRKAPDLGAVLDELADVIRPMGWSGSLADILQKRSVLFQSLYDHENAEIRAWAREQYSALQETIERQREREDLHNLHNSERNESFE